MIGKININGHIGDSYIDPQGMAHVGTNLLSVIDQVATYPEATAFEISINSPGGYVDVGDAIYDYLLGLKKKGVTLTTIQTGLIGSIATKLFLAGDRRIVDDRYKFWIHNPFQENVSGDADALQAAADAVGATEKSLRKFYAEFTQITDEGLDGLMKIETGLTADQCIKFKFATEKKLVPAFNSIKPMKKDEKSFLDHVKAFFQEEKKKGVQPTKAAIPSSEAKSLVVNLADGMGSFWVEGEVVAEGAPAFLLDAEGQPTAEPLADGEYALEDGSKVTVTGGLVSAVTMKEEEKIESPAPLTKEEIQEMINNAIKSATDASLAAVASVKTEAQNEILAIKKTMRIGVQPTKGFMSSQSANTSEAKTITQIQLEREQARKKNLNAK